MSGYPSYPLTYQIVDNVASLNRIFRPGVPSGTDAVADTALITACLATIASAGGGTLCLDRGYFAVAESGSDTIGPYRSAYHALQILQSNLVIEGRGVGGLILTAAPTHVSSFTLLQVGNGLYDIDVSHFDDNGYGHPTIAWLNANGTFFQNVSLKNNLLINTDVLTNTNLTNMSSGIFGSVVNFAGIIGGEISNVTVSKGWGVTGAISSTALTQNMSIHHNTVSFAYRYSYWFDGILTSTVHDNAAATSANTIAALGGLVISTTTDYGQTSDDNSIYSNTTPYLVISGWRNDVYSNTVRLPSASTNSNDCIFITASSTSGGCYPIGNNKIHDNDCDRDVGGSAHAGIGVHVTTTTNAGLPIATDSGNEIYSNTFGANLQAALNWGSYAINNWFHGNTRNCPQLKTNDNATASGNVTTDP